MTQHKIDMEKLKKINKLCRALCVQVWGSDECRLRKYNEFHDSDVEEIAATMFKLAEENERLKESNRLYAEDFNQQGRKGFADTLE